jgi:hypothetical protein
LFCEPYSAKCLEPLAERINSSNVPPDFKLDDPATDSAVVEEAQGLSASIEETPQPAGQSPAAADELEAEFGARVNTSRHFDSACCRAFQEWHDFA